MARIEVPLREITLEELNATIGRLYELIQTHNHSEGTGSSLITGSSITDGIVKGFLQSQNFITGASGSGMKLNFVSGVLEANQGNFRGDITGASGSFSGSLSIGTGNNVVKADGTSGLWCGHADFASAPFTVSLGGVLTASGVTISGTITATAGTIGGFDIGADYIRDTANSMGMASTVTGGDDVRFWAGATFANRATAPFRITEAGVLTITSATIGGWTINATSIYTGTEDYSGYTANAGDITIYSNGADASIHAKNFYIDTSGNLTCTGATISGTITATAGAIGGWIINSTSIYTGTEDHSGYTANVGDITIYSDGTDASIHAKNFYIDSSGNLTCTGATISGAVTITSGSGIANLSDAGALAVLSVIGNAYITDLAVSKLTAGTITSKAITLAISDGTGDVKIQAGKTDFGDTTAGFILGMDDSDSNKPKFEVGDATNSLSWNGNTLAITGTITATTGTIGGWTLGATTLASTNTNISLDSSNSRITLKAQAAVGDTSAVKFVEAADTNDFWVLMSGQGDAERLHIAWTTNGGSSYTTLAIFNSDGETQFNSAISLNSSTLAVRLALDGSGNLEFTSDNSGGFFPSVDDTEDLGSSSKQWQNLYVDGIAYIDGIGETLPPSASASYDLGTSSLQWAVGYINKISGLGTANVIDLGNASRIVTNQPYTPSTDGGLTLGTSSYRWQSLMIYDEDTTGMVTGELRFNALTGTLHFHDGVAIRQITMT